MSKSAGYVSNDAPRVLIVDDDPDYLVLIRDILENAPHTTSATFGVSSIEEAILEIDSGEYDLCLCDYRLGAVTGLDLLRYARSTKCYVPIIILTGQGDSSTDLEAMKLGAVDYLPKDDLSPGTLERTIRYAIERSRAEQERLNLELQLRQAQKMETIGTLAGGIAHDFNNILTPILCYSQTALLEQAPNAASREDIEHVILAANRAKELVRQILAFSRRMEQEKKLIHVQSVVEEALKLLRASLPATIEMRTQLEAEECRIVADPTQIHQVLMNLCANAAHAMSKTGGTLDVALKPTILSEESVKAHPGFRAGAYVWLSIRDTGQGMDPSTLGRIFEPFFTTKEVGEGTGLGLSVVHGIVLNHEGAIRVDSELGVGTTFHVYLPIAEQAPAIRDTAHVELSRGCEHILYVDDEAEIALAGKRILERFGYRVTAISDSTAALALFRRKSTEFDLVITDLTMPRLTGDELARQLSIIRPGIPIILTTGSPAAGPLHQQAPSDIQAFMAKPLDIKELTNTVRRVLNSA